MGNLADTPDSFYKVSWTQGTKVIPRHKIGKPEGLHKEQVLALMEAFYDMGPFGFRGPAAHHIPDHLTSPAENGTRTTQLIASGYHCPSNRFLQGALAHLEENYLFITSANISSHLTGQEEPAHYEMKEIQRAFEDHKGILMMRHPNEEEARARYPEYAPMSTSILGFYELHTDDRGRPALFQCNRRNRIASLAHPAPGSQVHLP
jgi:hypothetical protein